MTKQLDQRVPTAALWAIVTGGVSEENCTWGECGEVFKQIYPGIDFRPSVDRQNLDMLARHDLQKHFSQNKEFTIMDCDSDTQAIMMYGAEMTVPVIKPCSGQEWKEWLTELPQEEVKHNSVAYKRMALVRKSLQKNSMNGN